MIDRVAPSLSGSVPLPSLSLVPARATVRAPWLTVSLESSSSYYQMLTILYGLPYSMDDICMAILLDLNKVSYLDLARV